jgi:hypothetical protein
VTQESIRVRAGEDDGTEVGVLVGAIDKFTELDGHRR